MTLGHAKVKLYEYRPVGYDIWDKRDNQPEAGTIVRKVQPYGCPKNGTMGHCYAEPVDGGNYFLCLEKSLIRVKGT